jgi:hypothetical protein
MDIDQDLARTTSRPPRRWGGFSVNQWAALTVLGGLLLAIGAGLVLVWRSAEIDIASAQPTFVVSETATRAAPRDAIPTAKDLYWPPDPVPLATPNAPGDLLWWDARFAYRRVVLLDVAAARAPAGTWARVLLDVEREQREDRMRSDANDLVLTVWDGQTWWQLPRALRSGAGAKGWELRFQLQGAQAGMPDGDPGYLYCVYYGNHLAEPSPSAEDLQAPALLLGLDAVESIEWGPEVIWKAEAEAVQNLVSPDGRILFESPPGALQEDTRVQLRTVPLSERGGQGPLPDYELHADPPPGPPGPDNVVHWEPPLSVTINWAGLAVDPAVLETWAHFAYDTHKGVWYSVPVEYDQKHGLIRFVTDQP